MPVSPIICTIVSSDYLAQARVLGGAFLDQHYNGKCYILVFDGTAVEREGQVEGLEYLDLKSLEFPNPTFYKFKYNGLELACALKPFLIEHLLKQHEKVLYFDADICIYDSLEPLLMELDVAPVLLTPHLEQDFPDDGKEISGSTILMSGLFNAGFIGAKQTVETQAFLTWFKKKLLQNCVIDHAHGYFVDQRYLDLAVCIFPWIGWVRDPGCNVGYWNLHARTIERQDGAGSNIWTSDGVPLRFFHFSGYRIESPEVISLHQTRFSLADNEPLRVLFSEYQENLIRNGAMEVASEGYRHDRFSRTVGGRKIPYGLRKFYRRFSGSSFVNKVSDPFGSKFFAALGLVFEVIGKTQKYCAKLKSLFRWVLLNLFKLINWVE